MITRIIKLYLICYPIYFLFVASLTPNKEFNHYIEFWNKHSTLPVTSYVTFGDLGVGVAGVCYPVYRLVIIDTYYWYYSSYKQKMALMLHELAHCEKLWLYESKDKTHVMYYQAQEDKNINIDKYVEQLFKKRL